MKTTVSVNQLSIYCAVLFCYLGPRGEGDNVSSNTNPDIAESVVTNLPATKPQNCVILRRARSVHNKNSSVEPKNQRQVSREAGFSKLVEVG